ncbi:hypothetical protein [Pseudovibrio sp. SPO723]|uniref:hypothetical protein n=1 Tax=Nesiotobacter zosterae TaxID=392721 RepID=UPI0029C5845D|nr:hypothetical protein [Pseudovibrio sp. SPO723]MDX5592598.1 hypothetical protein [Pseudovibrio sp. SPO723]
MKTRAIAVALLLGLAGCQTAQMPQSEMEVYANRAAGAEIAAASCPNVGGYEQIQRLKKDGDENRKKAKALGATRADFQAAYNRVQQQARSVAIWNSPAAACQQLVAGVAWNGTSKPEGF